MGDAAGDDVAGSEFGARVHVEHEPGAERVVEHRALAPHRLRDEGGAGHREGGRVELVELQVGDGRAGPPGRCHAVAGGQGRIRGVRVEGARTAGGEDDRVRREALQVAVGAEQNRAAHPAARQDEVDEHGVFAHEQAGPGAVDSRGERAGPFRAFPHGGDQGGLDGGAGRVAAGVQHARPRMRGFEPAGDPGFIPVEVDAEADEVPHPGGTLRAQHPDGGGIAEARPGPQGVDHMGFHRVVGEHRRGDATLGVPGVAVRQGRLGHQGDGVAGVGRPDGGDQSGQAAADDEDVGHFRRPGGPVRAAGPRASVRGRCGRAPRRRPTRGSG